MIKRKSLIGWVDVFLVLIIFLNILDFFEVIGSELDYIKKIISWTLLGYLLFEASPTKVFFGEKHALIDTTIIFSYFFLIVKNLIWYANTIWEEASVLKQFFLFLINNASFIEQTFFVIGICSLLGLSLFVAFKIPFTKRSIMGVLHEDGPVKTNKILERLVMSVLVFFGFFVMVFNMMMEWLAIAVDATLLLIALLFWSIFLIRHKVSIHKFLDNVGNIGVNFYEWFIDHFRYKETFLLGIAGLLVLHLLTDIGIFLVPYIIGIKDPLYLSAIVVNFETVWEVLLFNFSNLDSFIAQISLIVTFLMNMVGYIILFCSPAFIWFELYHRRHPKLPWGLLILFISSLPAMLLASLFSLKRLNMFNLVGVNIQLESMLLSPLNIVIIAFLIILFFGVSFFISKNHKWQVKLSQLWVVSSLLFFGQYIMLYFLDVTSYQQEVVFAMVNAHAYFFAIIFFIFQALLILFYVGGLFIFLYELGHRPNHSKKEKLFKNKN